MSSIACASLFAAGYFGLLLVFIFLIDRKLSRIDKSIQELVEMFKKVDSDG